MKASQQPLLRFTEVLGMATGIIGACILASATDASKYGYLLFLVSATAIVIASWIRGSGPMILLNGFYIVINLFGVLRWFKIL